MINKKILLIFVPFLLLTNIAYAHCPLCVVGVAAAAGGAAYLGVNQAVIGLFIGAFAVSIGWWISRLIKRNYIKFQRELIILFSFLTTIIPLLTFLNGFYPIYLNIFGDYGSLFNRTYLINIFLFGSIIGSIIVYVSPFLSRLLTKTRNNKIMSYQGIIITFALLVISSIIIQLII